MRRWTIVGIGLVFLPVFGPAGSTCGQDNFMPNEPLVAPLPEAIAPAEPADSDQPGDAGECETCGEATSCACDEQFGDHFYSDWFCGTCDMPPHYPYCPPMHGYYYFRPYNYRDVTWQQLLVASWGGDPRAPYKNDVFQRVYAEYKADHAESPQPPESR